jgi:hypothetical protein
LPDVLMLLFGAWVMLSLVVVHGATRIPFAGITVIEMIGGYLVGRICIRNLAQHKAFFSVYFKVLLLLLPLVVFELATSRSLILEVLETSLITRDETRMGLYRAQAVFPHPILWGLFCAMAIGNLFYIYGGTLRAGGYQSLLALGMTYSSLSSGPFLAGLLQIGLIFWGSVTKGRWMLLFVISVIGYVVIDALSNRTPVQIIIEELTFSSHTGWYRLNIWEYGTQSVLNNPVFGIGLNDWERPSWMTGGSVDNFWLLIAMRHGLPGILLLGAAVALTVLYILRTPITDVLTKRMRTGYLVTMVGLFMTLTTVHVWEQVAVLVFFYIGMGAWLFSDAARRAGPGSGGDAAGADKRDLRYSRYPTRNRAQSAHPAAHPYARPRSGETTS